MNPDEFDLPSFPIAPTLYNFCVKTYFRKRQIREYVGNNTVIVKVVK